MNILLIGECYSENLGDAVICQLVAKVIESQHPEAQITFFDVSGRTGYQRNHALGNYTFSEKCSIKLPKGMPSLVSHFPFFSLYKQAEIRYHHAMTLFRELTNRRHFDLAIPVTRQSFGRSQYGATSNYQDARLLNA